MLDDDSHEWRGATMSSLFKPTTEAEHQAPGHSASRTRGRLIPRKVRFDWSKTPLEWIPGQPFASHFINEINKQLASIELQLEELVRRSEVPKEQGEADLLRMLDTSRAIPTR